MKLKKLAGLTAGFALAFSSSVAMAMDTALYTKLANDTIQEANGGFVANINELIKVQEKLIQLGVEGSKLYMLSHPEHAELLGLVVAEANNMKRMSLDEIEEQWHEGKFLESRGYDLEKMDHFGELFSLMDSVIHPATSYIALKEYKRTRDANHLARASAELIEVVEHVAHISSDTAHVANP